jgi:hypothetical protein
MIYLVLACLVLILVTPLVEKNVESSSKWFGLVPLLFVPFVNAADVVEYSFLIQPILITSFVIYSKVNLTKKVMAILPCFLLMNLDYLNLYVIFQIAYFAILYFEKRSSTDLLFSTLLILAVLISNKYISGLLVLCSVLITLIESKELREHYLKRLIPLLSFLTLFKNQPIEVGQYITVVFSLLGVAYLGFTHRENLVRNNMVLITGILTFLVPAYMVISFIFLSVFFFELLTTVTYYLRMKFGKRFYVLSSLAQGTCFTPSLILAFMMSHLTSFGFVVSIFILTCSLMTSLKISIEEIEDKNSFWGEVVSIMVLVLLLFPINSIPTKFFYLVDLKVIDSLAWDTVSTTLFILSFLLLGTIGYIKFKLNIEKYLYKFNYLNFRRSDFYSIKISKTFGEFEPLVPRKIMSYERPLGLEFLLLCSDFITKRFHVITWVIVLSLIFTMVYSV